MTSTLSDIDAQRARWLRYRRAQGLAPNAGEEFALGGLGRHADAPNVRLLFLPADPEGDVVPLNGEILAWLKESRPSPYGGAAVRWGNTQRACNDALVVYDQYRDDAGWTRYLALHRHGGIEAGGGHVAYENRDKIRIFHLRLIVGWAWAAAALYAEAVERWRIAGPVEITVALKDTGGATLGGFAEGWAELGGGLWDFTRCLDDHVIIRREADHVLDPQEFALDLGDRIENAFGTVNRRHLAHRGDYAGRFDPRF